MLGLLWFSIGFFTVNRVKKDRNWIRQLDRIDKNSTAGNSYFYVSPLN